MESTCCTTKRRAAAIKPLSRFLDVFLRRGKSNIAKRSKLQLQILGDFYSSMKRARFAVFSFVLPAVRLPEVRGNETWQHHFGVRGSGMSATVSACNLPYFIGTVPEQTAVGIRLQPQNFTFEFHLQPPTASGTLVSFRELGERIKAQLP